MNYESQPGIERSQSVPTSERPRMAVVAFVALLAVHAKCADDEEIAGRDASVKPGTPPTGCTYVDDQVCWQCGKPIVDFNAMACRAKGDCFTFCGREHFPAGFSNCSYGGMTTEDMCKGVVVPLRGLFSGCTKNTVGQYSCRSCFGEAEATDSFGIDPAGVCYRFANNCLPSDLEDLDYADLEERCKQLPPGI